MTLERLTARVGSSGLFTTQTFDVDWQEAAPPGRPGLGVFGFTTTDAKYLAPTNAAAFGTHPYGGSNGWGQATGGVLPPNALAVNIRPRGKSEPLLDAQGRSCAERILAGVLDPVYRGIAQELKALDHDVIGTHWHEPLKQGEFKAGEPTTLWSPCFERCMDVFADEGVTNVVWYSCLMASQYKPNQNSPQGGDTFHTPSLIARLDGVGADLYLTANSRDMATDPEAQAFANYHPEKAHGLLEFGLWSDPDHQDECFDMLDAWYKAHPSWRALLGFFNNGGAGKDGRISPAGQVVWDRMARDPFYGRVA